MEEATRSNMKLSMPFRSRSILREEALAAWRFKPSDTAKDQDSDAARIFEASQRDMEMVIRALERELNSRPVESIIIGTSKEKIAGSSTGEVPSSSASSCDPGSPSESDVEAKASVKLRVSDPMVGQSESPGTRTRHAGALSRSCNNQRSIAVVNNSIGKRASRRRNKAPTTIMRADPSDFQAMVQQMTGLPLESSSKAAPSFFKPEAKRPEAALSLLKQPRQIVSNIIPSASSCAGLPVAINGFFGTRPNYRHPTAFCNNLAEDLADNSVDTATSRSKII